jgi:hypothetical protein
MAPSRLPRAHVPNSTLYWSTGPGVPYPEDVALRGDFGLRLLVERGFGKIHFATSPNRSGGDGHTSIFSKIFHRFLLLKTPIRGFFPPIKRIFTIY